MSDGDTEYVEGLRREIGEKMARDGEPLHETASDSARSGYRRGAIGWGSNTTPRLFGKGGNVRKSWTCLCGEENPRYLNQCRMCGFNGRHIREEDVS